MSTCTAAQIEKNGQSAKLNKTLSTFSIYFFIFRFVLSKPKNAPTQTRKRYLGHFCTTKTQLCVQFFWEWIFSLNEPEGGSSPFNQSWNLTLLVIGNIVSLHWPLTIRLRLSRKGNVRLANLTIWTNIPLFLEQWLFFKLNNYHFSTIGL